MHKPISTRVSSLLFATVSCGIFGACATEQTRTSPAKQAPRANGQTTAPSSTEQPPAAVVPAETAGAGSLPNQVAADRPAPEISPTAPALAPFEITVPGTTAKLAFVPIPGDANTKPFYLARTETTWDMYDAYVFAMDRTETEKDPPDAFARPSKPYILMDRGFGHAGYPVISVSHKGAAEFCKWLSVKSGKRFRLPSESEWQRAAELSSKASVPLSDFAWFKDNSELEMRPTTHPIATRKADALGLHDMLGNASEWTTSEAGTGVARGGSFKDLADAVTPAARRPDDKSLNRTDPQIPRSVWWLADGGFIGFRVLCEPASTQ